jgi:hypothetical protein
LVNASSTGSVSSTKRIKSAGSRCEVTFAAGSSHDVSVNFRANFNA